MPMGLSVKHNLDEVLDKLDAWASSVVEVAAPRALNKLLDQAQVAGLRKVNDIYRIGPRTFEKYARVSFAVPGQLEASITVRGAGFPLYLFNPRQVRGKGGGVRVTLKGRSVFIPHAFIAKMRSGHVGVFARGAYGGKGKNVSTGESFGKFQFGRKRYSINELFTFSAPGAFSNPDVTEAMNERVFEQYGSVINQEIRFASR